MHFMECSAKTGQNIEGIFSQISEVISNKIAKGELDPKNESIGIKLGAMEAEPGVKKDRKNCCWSVWTDYYLLMHLSIIIITFLINTIVVVSDMVIIDINNSILWIKDILWLSFWIHWQYRLKQPFSRGGLPFCQPGLRRWLRLMLEHQIHYLLD